MTTYLGDYTEDATLYHMWNSFDANGASITRATDGTISVYKNNGLTQSTAGITDTEDFDGLTGIHAIAIDLSSNAFYATGGDYAIVLSGSTINGQTVNAVLATFSIENRHPSLALATVLSNQSTIEGKIDTVEGKVDTVDTVVDGLATDMTTALSNQSTINTNIGTIVSNQSTIDGKIDTVDTVVDAIKAQTDQMSFTGGDLNATLDGETVTLAATTHTGATVPTVTTVNGLATSVLNAIANAVLGYDLSSVTGAASRSALNALRFLRNKWTISGTTLTVYEEDDTTSAWTGTVTTDNAADPITANDPT